jgi:membrane dipeptidase
MKKQLIIILLLLGVFGCGEIDRDHMKIHTNALVADMHSDTVLRMKRGLDISVRDTSGHIDIPRLQDGGVDLQVFACWVSTDTPLDESRGKVDELIDTLEAQIRRHPEEIAICLTATEAEQIVRDGKIAAFIGIENGVAIANSLDNLRHFYDRGVRYLTLTHTASSDWCVSSADTMPAFNGLTDFGREVVGLMNELGMIVDLSHASVSAVEEALKITTDPVIASHSCVHSICGHDRNLTDEQINAIATNGGVIGINYYGGYISAEWNAVTDSIYALHEAEVDSLRELYKDDYGQYREAMRPIYDKIRQARSKLSVNVSSVVDHIDHIVNLVGANYVGLGSDFDGVHGLPDGLTDCSMVPNITKELVARNYTTEDIEKILGGNFMRIFRQVCNQ